MSQGKENIEEIASATKEEPLKKEEITLYKEEPLKKEDIILDKEEPLKKEEITLDKEALFMKEEPLKKEDPLNMEEFHTTIDLLGDTQSDTELKKEEELTIIDCDQFLQQSLNKRDLKRVKKRTEARLTLAEAKDYNNLLETRTTQLQKSLNNQVNLSNDTRYTVDLMKFPIEFKTEEEALKKYNEIGLLQKIQFKVINRSKENDKIMRFTLCCYKRKTVTKKIDLGLQLKEVECGNCPVAVRFRWIPRKKMYIRRLSGLKMIHNHPLDVKERHYTHNELIQREVKMLLNSHIPVANIRNILNTKFNATLRYSDIYGIVKGFQNGSKNIGDKLKTDFQRLLELLEELRGKDPLTQYEFEFEDDEDEDGDENGSKIPCEINRILIMTGSMRKLYEQYHDVIFMDATYKTNKHDMPLTVITGIDNEGRNTVLAYALLKKEDKEAYIWLMQTFLKFVEYNEPGIILTDFDPSMCHGIERTFEKTTHLLCQWHVMNNFKRHFLYLQKKKGFGPKNLYQKIINLIYTPSAKEFQEIQEVLFSPTNDDIGDEKLQYLRQMFAIKEKWAEAFCPIEFNAATHTISRGESVNSQIKNRVFAKSSMCDIFRLFQELEDRSINKIITYYRTHQREIYHHPLLKGMYEYYSSYAFKFMLYEYMMSHECETKKLVADDTEGMVATKIVNAQQTQNGQYMIREIRDREKYMVTLTDCCAKWRAVLKARMNLKVS
ncbi:unnamed protein product [Moneuplotes crassus]|uniref:MULE transposase domain-containing protein n=1 Tax=Euplotes crassus TaxID=5936 RepID=A0AAD1Y681_EUPCR|nr:unnamed protein product [Moneuplotes crassus]